MILFQNKVNIGIAMTHTKIIPTRPEIFSTQGLGVFKSNAFKMKKKIQNI